MVDADAMIIELEFIQSLQRKLSGYIVNHLSSVNFQLNMKQLGHHTLPLSNFHFSRRNVHYTCAAAGGAKENMNVELRRLLGELVPDCAGMVQCPPKGGPERHMRNFLYVVDMYLWFSMGNAQDILAFRQSSQTMKLFLCRSYWIRDTLRQGHGL